MKEKKAAKREKKNEEVIIKGLIHIQVNELTAKY
jgi:hypothetical protein